MKSIAFYDFDGTISSIDSLSEFLRFVGGKKYFLNKYFNLLHVYLGMRIGIINYKVFKMKLIKKILINYEHQELINLSITFNEKFLIPSIKEKAAESLKKHKNENNKVVIVSASLAIILKPFCDYFKIDLISNEIKFKNSICTGEVLNDDCNGMEKVNRIKDRYSLDEYKEIFAYGDTQKDYPMLDLANHKYFKPFWMI